MFTIEPDPARKLIRVTATGFWDVATTRRYEEELTAALNDMRRLHASFDMLVNLLNAIALSQEAAVHIQRVYGEQRKRGVRKFASICPGALQAMQIKRLAGRDEGYRTFPTEEEALAWLAE